MAVGRYPVVDELRALGFMWFADELEVILSEPADVRDAVADHNLTVARRHFAEDRFAEDIAAVLGSAGVAPSRGDTRGTIRR